MTNKISSKALYSQIYQALLPAIPQAQECGAITWRLLAHYFQLAPIQTTCDKPIVCTPLQRQLLAAAIARLKHQEPIQYVLGEAHFLGRDFLVSPEVLIPRPETEMLVQHIIDENRQPAIGVLDIGTGSGCIAITLQQELNQATVHALDISAQAIRVAQANAERLGADLCWLQRDILHQPLPTQYWDIIVSNPPYVRVSEKQAMERRVLDYEPAQALFVPDEAPLCFYERIVALAPYHLAVGGRLYLEINEAFGSAVADLLRSAGFSSVRIGQDLNGKERWVEGVWAY